MNFLFLDTIGYESALRLSGHHYARLLAARGHRVLSLSAPVSPLHRLVAGRSPSIAKRFENHRKGFVVAPGGVHHYVPHTLFPVRDTFPMDRAWWLRLGAKSYSPDVMTRLRRMNFEPDVISLQNLTFYPLALQFPDAVMQYRMTDIMDEFSDIPASILEYERLALDRADLISLTSDEFMVKLTPENRPKAIHAPNGVDVSHFEAERPRPPEYEGIEGPIAVYVGALREWFDWDLLRHSAEACPEVHFFAVSPDRPREDVLSLANFTHIPGVAYEDVPAYYQHATLSIIPFADTPLVAPVNPIKMFESLAAGTPVVAVSWAELRKMKAPIALAGDPEEFVAAIRGVVAGERTWESPEWTEFLKKHSWAGNLDVLLARIEAVRSARHAKSAAP